MKYPSICSIVATGALLAAPAMTATVVTAATAKTPAAPAAATAKPAAATAKPAAAAARDEWPDTRAGAIGRGWVAAFDSGEKAIVDFYNREMSAQNLAKKPAEQRLGHYREARERFGKLTLGEVVASAPNEVQVTLIDSDGASHKFTFTLESEEPHKLVTVTMLDHQHGHGFGGFHH